MTDKNIPDSATDHDSLESLVVLAYADEDARVQGGCRSPEWWFELAAGHADREAAQAALDHAADCARCSSERTLAEAFVEAQNEATASAAVGQNVDDEIAKPLIFRVPEPETERLSGSERSSFGSARWLAAAAVVLAIAGTYSLTSVRAPDVRPPGSGETMRSQFIDVDGPSGDIESAPTQFEWTDVGATAYKVEFKRVDGKSVLERNVSEPRLTLTPEERAKLERFVTYRMTVTSTTQSDAKLSSNETSFRITGAQYPQP